MRVLFWGTPAFALPPLRALREAGHELVGVVTQPDRRAGRGRRLRPSPVKEEALRLGLPVFAPERPRGEEFLGRLRKLDPEVSVVAAYGHLLADEVLSLPRLGSLNIHPSLLPELRGAAPVNWSIILGHEQGGVTIMRMVRELDAGPILLQIPLSIGPETTAGELSDAAARAGAEAIVRVLAALERGAVEEREQDHARATYAPKLTREDARIDWTLPAESVARWIRGCDPSPAAWSELGDDPVQLFSPSVAPPGEPASPGMGPGTVAEADPRRGVRVTAGEGSVWVREVKPAGRKRMEAAAWVRGRGVVAGDRFT